MNIYFVRHGKTIWNLEGRIQGWSDTPLLEDDKSAYIAAEKIKEIKFDCICSSDLGRAIKTKQIILNELGLEDENLTFEEFREVGFGELEGVHIDYIKANYADFWRKYKLYIEDFDPGKYFKGFESVNTVRKRALKKINELKQIYGENANVLVISHGSLISIMQNIGKTLKEPAIIPNNGEVVLLKF